MDCWSEQHRSYQHLEHCIRSMDPLWTHWQENCRSFSAEYKTVNNNLQFWSKPVHSLQWNFCRPDVWFSGFMTTGEGRNIDWWRFTTTHRHNFHNPSEAALTCPWISSPTWTTLTPTPQGWADRLLNKRRATRSIQSRASLSACRWVRGLIVTMIQPDSGLLLLWFHSTGLHRSSGGDRCKSRANRLVLTGVWIFQRVWVCDGLGQVSLATGLSLWGYESSKLMKAFQFLH